MGEAASGAKISGEKSGKRPLPVPSRADVRERLGLAIADARRELAYLGINGEPTDGHAFAASKVAAYHNLIVSIREIVRSTLPASATVAVVNKGDAELLKLDGRTAWHFPRNADGSYAGHYPATSADAIEQLEAVRAEGARFLIFPGTALWWLEFYGDFRAHMEAHYRVVAKEDEAFVIFALDERRSSEQRQSDQPQDASIGTPPADEEDETALRIELAQSLKMLGRAKEAQETLLDGLDADPSSARLHTELMHLATAAGSKAEAQEHGAKALALAPNDYAVNMALVKAAWRQQRPAAVEERLNHLVAVFPSDGVALNDLMNFHCSRIEARQKDSAMLARFIAHLAVAGASQRITPATHLRISETLGANNFPAQALASLDAALKRLDFGSELLQGFVARLLRSIVSEKSAIPFSDKLSLAAFLTHAGNGFAAVADRFRSEACYRLAVAADGKSWNSASWAARFNLAFTEMARGSVVTALQHIAKATRLFPDETARIVWPVQDEKPWPRAAFDLSEAFGKLKARGVAWPKITVITPSFNQVAYVEETLLSVLHQHYPNLEYFVIDGGSTDGSAEVLRRYESRVTKLIIEKDEGQTDAINKGLRLSSGEIILWINSDDLLGPGALFMIALAWLEDGADIIAGFCCEHTERRFGLINLPAVTQATFNTECLGDIFHYWLKGHYFYQPEVAFSRRIFEKAGASLDKSLHYSMDYEFWLRCAAAGARMSVVHWPIGLFRKHEMQKTSRLDDTVIEQASVRNRFVIPRPGFERSLQIRSRLGRAFAGDAPRVAVVSTRASKIFSADTGRELSGALAAEGLQITYHSDATGIDPRKTDLVILLVHLYREHEALRKLREGGFDGAVAGWFWDNHHHVFDNHSAAADLDVCFPGHGFAADYLHSHRYISAPPVPLCVTQWTAAEGARFFEKHGGTQRTDALYGGFVRYEIANKRNQLISSLTERGMKGVYFLEENALERYFGLSLSDRFKTWCSHKVSICLPLSGDLSQRFFDALLTGQIPIVPDDIHDLDEVIPLKLQQELPIIRFSKYTATAVEEAHAKALKAFARDGAAGILRRHRFALGHTFAPRIRSILSTLRDIAAGS